MKGKILKIFGIVILGGIGGVVMERTLVPWLIHHTVLSRFSAFTLERTTVVQPKEEIIIDRAQALERSVALARQSLVLVERKGARGEVITTRSGVIVTADGLLATDGAIVNGPGVIEVLYNRQSFPASVFRQDEAYGVALLRISLSSLPVTAFVDGSDIVVGKMLFLLRAAPSTSPDNDMTISLSDGIMSGELLEGVPQVSMQFSEEDLGAPIFTVEGKLLGLVGASRRIVSSAILRSFVD